ncbi:MAG: OmpA family protein [Flammeovirgaceae bacterium]|jgi:outer membrane protein OmpA-like peptidoglycan-associated protein|nr:OmpA family protein [Flammeovirgaceae bacterium]
MQRFLLLLLFIFPLILVAQEKPHTDQSLYVVIGAFGVPRNAIEFTENANKQGYPAQFELNPKRKLFYVYVLHTEDRKAAVNECIRLQKQSPYSDTWMYSGLLGENPQVVKINEAERKEAMEQLAVAEVLEASPKEGMEEKVEAEVKKEEEIVIAKEMKPEPAVVKDPDTKSFLFRITALVDGDTLAGDVDVFDADAVNKNRKSATYRGNDAVNVKPVNKSGSMVLECEVFGYRKVQLPINYNSPQDADGVSLDGDQFTVSFELVRLQKGDKAIMFNVYFYKDAAIMRPESRYEVGSLLEMMQENPKYKIRIHGHTNGNSAGKIVSMGDSKNFFALTRDNKEGHGSAKKLSEERAMLIQQYLVENGVDAKRMEVRAWGGKQPIYEVDHSAAQANVRVEIEILEN